MYWIRVIIRLIRRGPRLLNEIDEALDATRKGVLGIRHDFLKGNLTQSELAKELDRIAKECNDVIQVIGEILD